MKSFELIKIKNGDTPDGDTTELTDNVEKYLETIKQKNELKETKNKGKDTSKDQKYYIRPSHKEEKSQYYKAKLMFKDDCEMENIRSYTVIHNIVDLVNEVYYKPNDIIEYDQTAEDIKRNGFLIVLKTKLDSEVIISK